MARLRFNCVRIFVFSHSLIHLLDWNAVEFVFVYSFVVGFLLLLLQAKSYSVIFMFPLSYCCCQNAVKNWKRSRPLGSLSCASATLHMNKTHVHTRQLITPQLCGTWHFVFAFRDEMPLFGLCNFTNIFFRVDQLLWLSLSLSLSVFLFNWPFYLFCFTP